MDKKNFEASDFRKNHPGGSLGERLKVQVSEVMMTGNYLPIATPETNFDDTVAILNEKNVGAVLVVEDSILKGIITDGDIRRLITSQPKELSSVQAREIMTSEPKTIKGNLLAADALSIMQRHEVTALPVTDSDRRLEGLLHLHDLLGKGEFRLLV